MSGIGKSSKPTESGSPSIWQPASREEVWAAFSKKEKADITEIANKFDGKFEKGDVHVTKKHL